MIVYTSRCLACSHKQLHRKLVEYSLLHKIKYETRKTSLNPKYASEASKYGLTLPFVVRDGKAMKIEDL